MLAAVYDCKPFVVTSRSEMSEPALIVNAPSPVASSENSTSSNDVSSSSKPTPVMLPTSKLRLMPTASKVVSPVKVSEPTSRLPLRLKDPSAERASVTFKSPVVVVNVPMSSARSTVSEAAKRLPTETVSAVNCTAPSRSAIVPTSPEISRSFSPRLMLKS